MSRHYYYLSNPYNGSPSEMRERAQAAAQACATLLRGGVYAWSPIVHNHAMMAFSDFSLEERRELLLPYDFSLLRAAKGMIVLKLAGWEVSYGVTREIELCEELGLPVWYLAPEEVKAWREPK
jgi:hypothetical protein